MERHELTIKETQAISLEILHTIAKICEMQHLRYALIYGTLIGAVRHHGYIPCVFVNRKFGQPLIEN